MEGEDDDFSKRPPTVIYLGNHNVLDEYEQSQAAMGNDSQQWQQRDPETPRNGQPAMSLNRSSEGEESEDEPQSPQSVIALGKDEQNHAPGEEEKARDHNGASSEEHSPQDSSQAASEDNETAPETLSTAETQHAETVSRPSTADAPKASTIGSMVFVRTALETIVNSKEARRKKPLLDAAVAALTAIKEDRPIEAEAIFLPLSLATETTSIPLTTASLDCIGKLITYSYFSMAQSFPPSTDASGKLQTPLIERAIDTICDCFQDEATPAEVQLQIVKSLLAAVLNDKIIVHGAGLLKAVRQVYNIFLLSKTIPNQQIAQGTLTQMVGTVFERVKARLTLKETRVRAGQGSSGRGTAAASQVDLDDEQPQAEENGTADDEDADVDASSDANSTHAPSTKELNEKMTLQSFENAKNFDDTRIGDNAPTMVTRAKQMERSRSVSSRPGTFGEEREPLEDDDEDEIYVKDAFLVFRSMCRLSTKVLAQEQLQDLKSQNMRSKLISLAIIRTTMNNNMEVFTSQLVTIRGSANNEPTSFGQAINQYLRLALSRNGASSVRQVFESSCEIFWLMLKDMRVMLKREIEVFLKEIYLSILERRNAPGFQKLYIMRILWRLSSEPKALVELYLNYDCDRTALDNMFQKTIELLAKMTSTQANVTPQQQLQYQEHHPRDSDFDLDWRNQGKMPPSLTTTALSTHPQFDSELPVEYLLKQQSLKCLVKTLRSLVDWSQGALADSPDKLHQENGSKSSLEESRGSLDPQHMGGFPRPSASETPTNPGTPLPEDDPGQFEKAKQRKTALSNGIRLFNYKPKRGIKQLIKDGFIEDDKPETIAAFIAQNDRLDKAMIGEYLGEGEPENVAIMHAFVNIMDFSKRRFVDALRQFLQSFRLPGEAQKIDRFMLKFAERYITGNPNAFANADTAYVLAYSVIMLNTDQHSSKLRGARMTPEDFIKNNRGINDNADLPDEYLKGIFNEISHNEIVLNTEREHAAALGIADPVMSSRTGLFSRDLSKEVAHQADQEMSNKAEQRLRSLIRAQRKVASKAGSVKYFPATSSKHVGPMFDVSWMSFLSGFSGPLQNTQNLETIKLCMEGIRLAIKTSCLFDLETPRVAFVTILANATNLGNLREMMAKNLEALKVLLDVALTEGNALKHSWSDILTCISQLDRFQLISGGVDEDILPDVRKASIIRSPTAPQIKRPSQLPKRQRSGHGPSSSLYQTEIAQETRSTDMIKTVDRIFTSTAELNGDAIVHFVRALSEVSWQEIQSSGQSESPRTYSLQKLVEISYYNMTRVRFEWTNIWQVLGEHFNEVGCHSNSNVVFFALDSLRQLSMRFMEIEELPGFKFQKDFLKPFEHVMANSSAVAVKDMVLRCLIQMIQARGENIRSGWKTMFGVFTVAAREPYESIVNLAFENVGQIYKSRFGVVIAQGAFADLVVCLTEFSKNLKFQRRSLQAIDMLKSTIPTMLRTPECPLSQRNEDPPRSSSQDGAIVSRYANRQTQEEQFWFPVLFAFHDVLMTGEDLEVRSQALNFLFDTLIQYGSDFPQGFWEILWRQLLYPIFMVLKSKSEMSKVANHEDLSVWLSTTMIQALRNMMALFTHYFDSLEYMLDRFLDLLALCICQENDTIARIGSNCLQTLILENVTKFRKEHWHKIVSAFVSLFDRTTAHQLFTATTSTSSTSNIAEDDETAAVNEPKDDDLSLNADRGPSVDESPQHHKTDSLNGLVIEHAEDDAGGPGSSVLSPTAQAQVQTELEDYRPQDAPQQQPVVVTAARQRLFNRIITRCILQLLMIETVNELFLNHQVYQQIPSPELLRLMSMLKKSYHFAKKFNNDKELRMRLFREGFMKQPPNLLKQESGSAATYISILVRMYFDEGEERRNNRSQIEAALVP